MLFVDQYNATFNCDFRTELESWCKSVEVLLKSSKEACKWLVELLAGDKGLYYLK